jgi:CRP/FNR family transcriptional regulator, cyclic AMP receptor protein
LDYDYTMLKDEDYKSELFGPKGLSSASRFGGMLPKLTSITEVFGITKIEELTSIFENVRVQTFKIGSMIFSQGSPCEYIYILKEGLVGLYQITPEGKRLEIGYIIPETVFGVRGLLSRTGHRNFAEAMKDSVTYIITKEQFLTFLKRQPEAGLRMLEAAYECLSLVEERLMKSSYSPVKVRLAYFLLNNSDSTTGMINNLTHEEIGTNIGAIRETVTDILNFMRQRGFVRLKRKQIQLVNRNGLIDIIKGWES